MSVTHERSDNGTGPELVVGDHADCEGCAVDRLVAAVDALTRLPLPDGHDDRWYHVAEARDRLVALQRERRQREQAAKAEIKPPEERTEDER